MIREPKGRCQVRAPLSLCLLAFSLLVGSSVALIPNANLHITQPVTKDTCGLLTIKLPPCGVLFRRRFGAKIYLSKGNNDSTKNPLLIDIVDNIAKVLSKPTPAIPSLPLGYPLALIGSTFLVPLSTSILLGAFFCIFAYIGRKVAIDDDDYDDNEVVNPSTVVDLFALGAATVSAVILSPSSNEIIATTTATSSSSGGIADYVAPALAIGATAYVALQATSKDDSDDNDDNTINNRTELSIEDEQLQSWDDRFFKNKNK